MNHMNIGFIQTVKPDSFLLERLKGSLAAVGLDFRAGGVWSTVAPFMETMSKVKMYSSMGTLVAA